MVIGLVIMVQKAARQRQWIKWVGRPSVGDNLPQLPPPARLARAPPPAPEGGAAPAGGAAEEGIPEELEDAVELGAEEEREDPDGHLQPARPQAAQEGVERVGADGQRNLLVRELGK